MGMIELDETEVMALRRNSELLNKTLNSKGREQLLRALKTANPDLSVPEIDAKEPVMEALGQVTSSMAEMRKMIEDDKASRENEKRMEKFQSQWSEGRQKAAKQGYAGDSLEALEKFMEEKGVAEHEIAIPAFEKMHPPAAPVNNTSGKFDFFARKAEDNDVLQKKLWSGDPSYLEDAVGQTLREIRGAA